MSDCITGLLCPKARQFSFDYLAATEVEADNIQVFTESLKQTLGCDSRQGNHQKTLFGILHENVLRSAKVAFPEATSDCIAGNIQGIITGIAAATAECNKGQAAFAQALLQNVAPHLGKLLACVFGADRAEAMELTFRREMDARAIQFIPLLFQLLQILMQLLCSGGAPAGGLCQPPPTPPAAGLCPPPEQPLEPLPGAFVGDRCQGTRADDGTDRTFVGR